MAFELYAGRSHAILRRSTGLAERLSSRLLPVARSRMGAAPSRAQVFVQMGVDWTVSDPLRALRLQLDGDGSLGTARRRAGLRVELGCAHVAVGIMPLEKLADRGDGPEPGGDVNARAWAYEQWGLGIETHQIQGTPLDRHATLVSALDLRIRRAVEEFADRSQLHLTQCVPSVLRAVRALGGARSKSTRVLMWTEPNPDGMRDPCIQLLCTSGGKLLAIRRHWVPTSGESGPEQASASVKLLAEDLALAFTGAPAHQSVETLEWREAALTSATAEGERA